MTYIKRKSAKQEKDTAKIFGGRVQIASGAIETMKGDVRTGEAKNGGFNNDDFLIENKFTDNDYYTMTKSVWNKISDEAFKDNMRMPMMQVDICGIGERLVVLEIYDYLTSSMYTNACESTKYEVRKVNKQFRINKEIVDIIDLEGFAAIQFSSGGTIAILRLSSFL